MEARRSERRLETTSAAEGTKNVDQVERAKEGKSKAAGDEELKREKTAGRSPG